MSLLQVLFRNFLYLLGDPVFREHFRITASMFGKSTDFYCCFTFTLFLFVFLLFCFVFLFWRDLLHPTFHFHFFELDIAPLMLQFDVLVLIIFNCKTQNSLYILMECFKFCYNILIILIPLR